MSSPVRPYAARRAAQLETVRIRGLDHQFYRWPGHDPQPILLVHGWGDTGETFQFLVDCLSPRHTLVAFDLRGFGRTAWAQDGYWFPDYLADLDAIIDRLSPDAPLDLIGHSMGGNIAMLYAGIRPQRIRRVVSLEGFGLPRTDPETAPQRYRRWLDDVRAGSPFATYDDYAGLVRVLAARNPRTPPDRLEFIARTWGRPMPDGRIGLRADPRHRRINPILYQREQAEACWRAITAPLLFVIGAESPFVARLGALIEETRMRTLIRDLTYARVPDAGHMLHHERPDAVATLIERFLTTQVT